MVETETCKGHGWELVQLPMGKVVKFVLGRMRALS